METKKIVLGVVIVVLAIAVLYTTFVIMATGNVQSAGQLASSAGGMVGGC